jgi:hypothetical protein
VLPHRSIEGADSALKRDRLQMPNTLADLIGDLKVSDGLTPRDGVTIF